MKKQEPKKSFLITGAASGIGEQTALHLSALGHSVFAIDLADIKKSDGITPFYADITSKDQLSAVADAIAASGVKLDGIICIAGIHTMASLVESDPEKLRRLIDVNLSGTMLSVRIFHRLLKPKGRVVLITSEVASYAPMPFNGLYNISKTALQCYAQALRQELNLIGQKVVAVLPGSVETPLAASSVPGTAALAESTQLYKSQSAKFVTIVEKFKGRPISPGTMARVVCRAALSKHPRLNYSKHRNIGLVLLSILPLRLQCAVIKLLLK